MKTIANCIASNGEMYETDNSDVAEVVRDISNHSETTSAEDSGRTIDNSGDSKIASDQEMHDVDHAAKLHVKIIEVSCCRSEIESRLGFGTFNE